MMLKEHLGFQPKGVQMVALLSCAFIVDSRVGGNDGEGRWE